MCGAKVVLSEEGEPEGSMKLKRTKASA